MENVPSSSSENMAASPRLITCLATLEQKGEHLWCSQTGYSWDLPNQVSLSLKFRGATSADHCHFRIPALHHILLDAKHLIFGFWCFTRNTTFRCYGILLTSNNTLFALFGFKFILIQSTQTIGSESQVWS